MFCNHIITVHVFCEPSVYKMERKYDQDLENTKIQSLIH